MSTQASDHPGVDRVERVCSRATSGDELFEALSTEVFRVVPFDGSMWFGLDPATLLAAAPSRFEAMDAGYCQTFWHGEFHDHDAILFRDLARQPLPAGSLRATTAERPLRSARYRSFVEPQGYDDELRAVFRTGPSTWAAAALYREKGRQPFDDRDVRFMGAISGIVGAAVRARAAAASSAAAMAMAPGLLVFDAQGMLTSANAEAARWLGEIYGPSEGDGWTWLEVLRDPAVEPDLGFAVPIIPLLARARAIADGHADGQARLRLRDRTGRWLVLHASCLAGGSGQGAVAVVVEPAKSAEVAPIVIEAYGLSARERDVVGAIARGLSTPEIAATLFLSAHTVRDYIKSIFEKVGVSSRGELVAKLFAEHYADPLHETAVHLH